MLEALGCRLGTSLVMELLATHAVGMVEDPWPLLDSMFRGRTAPPAAYAADVAATVGTYTSLSDERRELLQLLSRFALTTEQARRWWNPKERARAVRHPVSDRRTPRESLPCRGMRPRGCPGLASPDGRSRSRLAPDATVAAACPVPGLGRRASSNDARRVRAALVTVLRRAADSGDALLGETEAVDHVSNSTWTDLSPSYDWMAGNGPPGWRSRPTHLLADPERDIEPPACS